MKENRDTSYILQKDIKGFVILVGPVNQPVINKLCVFAHHHHPSLLCLRL
jgi:hypothetical protein